VAQRQREKDRAKTLAAYTAISMLVFSRCPSILQYCPYPRTNKDRHCVGGDESESGGQKKCTTMDRDYNVPLRIGTLFVVLVTSAIGVFAPLGLVKLPVKAFNPVVSTVIKQFGTGVVMSTALVHVRLQPRKADVMHIN
jgi:hypothetical protein